MREAAARAVEDRRVAAPGEHRPSVIVRPSPGAEDLGGGAHRFTRIDRWYRGPMPRSVALVQARMGSTRLPGKALAPLAGRPVLGWVLARVGEAPGLDEVAVATSTLERDAPVVAVAQAVGVRVVRGDERDVLDRYRTAAEALAADVVVRVTADCPLVDPEVIGRLLAARGDRDYAAVATGAMPPAPGLRRFPDGLDAEAFTRAALEAAWGQASAPYDREHVSPWIKRHVQPWWLEAEEDLGDERWTVDEPADLAFVRAVVERLGPEPFGYREVLALLAREPELRALNARVARPHPSRT